MKRLPLLLLLTLLAACAGEERYRRGADYYGSVTALRAAQTEGLDYSREVYYRGSAVSVLALHGGDIEKGTARLARRTASGDLNLYVFSGWLGRASGRLHVTATHFDDPDAVRIATAAVLGLAFHAQADRGAWVCVGGSNKKAAALVARRLEEAGFAAETPCPRLPGTSPKNIVNRAAQGGVQLEITLRLLDRLEKNAGDLSKFTGAVRLAAFEFVGSIPKTEIKQEIR